MRIKFILPMARNTLRGAFVLVLDSEQGAVAHELGKVCVYDAVALLDGIVARKGKLRGWILTKEWKIPP